MAPRAARKEAKRIERHGGRVETVGFSSWVTVIVSDTCAFDEYMNAIDVDIPIVTSTWIRDSIRAKKAQPFPLYKPDPGDYFRGCCVSVHQLPSGEKEKVIAGVQRFGGSCLCLIDERVTILLLQEPWGDEYSLAVSRFPDILILHIKWFNECMKYSTYVDPKKHMLSHEKSENVVENVSNESGSRVLYMKGRKLIVDSKYDDEKRQIYYEIIIDAGGMIVSNENEEFDVAVTDSRSSTIYHTARMKKKLVANHNWLNICHVERTWLWPFSRLIFAPKNDVPISGFEKLVISFSGYSKVERSEMMALICRCGAAYSKVVRRKHVTHLICQKPEGDKYFTATQWDSDGPRIVNALWLDNCYEKWMYLSEDEFGDISEKIPRLTALASWLTPERHGDGSRKRSRDENTDKVDDIEELPRKQMRNSRSKLKEVDKKRPQRRAKKVVETEKVDTSPPPQRRPKKVVETEKVDASPPPQSRGQTRSRKSSTIKKASGESSSVFLLSGSDEFLELAKHSLSTMEVEVLPITHHYDKRATHLVLEEIRRTEKFFCACAAGAKVLGPDFITTCKNEGKLPPWGNYEIKGRKTIMSNGKCVWEGAPRKWRQFRETNKGGPFHDWTCLLCPPGNTSKGIFSLLEKVLKIGDSSLFVDSDSEASLTTGRRKGDTVLVIALALQDVPSHIRRQDVSIVKPDYVLDYISWKEKPDVGKYKCE